jgi:hypothetical protein
VTRRSSRKITAEELQAQLRSDRDFQSRTVEREAERARRNAEKEDALIDFWADIAAAGSAFTTFEQIVRAQLSEYRLVAPIILRWLRRTRNDDARAALVRLLTSPFLGDDIARALVDMFVDDEMAAIRWEIGNALSEAAPPLVAAELIRLVADRRYGKAREMLVIALARTGVPEARSVVLQLLGDAELQGHALVAAREMALVESIPAVEELARNGKKWVRDEARRTLKALAQHASRGSATRARRRPAVTSPAEDSPSRTPITERLVAKPKNRKNSSH